MSSRRGRPRAAAASNRGAQSSVPANLRFRIVIHSISDDGERVIADHTVDAYVAAVGAACGSPHAAIAPAPAATAIPTGPTAPPAMSAGTPASEEVASPIDLEFSGKIVGRMTHVQVAGTLCAAPGDIISAILTGDV